MKSGSSIGSITAPISRTRRKRSLINDPLASVPIALAACVALSLILTIFIVSKGPGPTGDGINRVRDRHSKDVAPAALTDRIQSLRQPSDTNTSKRLGHPEGLLLHAPQGTIRIHFAPHLSGITSIQYIQSMYQTALQANTNADHSTTSTSCNRCNLYRAEPNLLLQGVLSQEGVSSNQVILGPCDVKDWKPTAACPPHDVNCGCHGPVMTRGMVGWAGGGHGPDFFIVTHSTPVDWWEHQHTVWGMINDEASLKLVEKIYELPAEMGGGMRMLRDKIQFRIELF